MTYDVKSTVAFLKILRAFSTVGGRIANHRLKTGFSVECRNFGFVSKVFGLRRKQKFKNEVFQTVFLGKNSFSTVFASKGLKKKTRS